MTLPGRNLVRGLSLILHHWKFLEALAVMVAPLAKWPWSWYSGLYAHLIQSFQPSLYLFHKEDTEPGEDLTCSEWTVSH